MNTNVENRTQNTTRSIAWGVIAKIVGIIMPFLVRTVMIYTMGMIYTGLSSLFTSILQVLSLAELGVGSALVFSMYEPMANADDDKVCALLNFYRKAYRIIGLIILVIGLALMPFLNYLVAGEVPSDVNLYILYGIHLLNNALGYFLFAYKQSLLQASQRVDLINKIDTVLKIVLNTIQIIVLLLFHNYYAYAIIVPAITILNNIWTAYITDKYYPQYKCNGNLNKEELDSIKKKVGGMIFQKVGSVVLMSVDTIVISSFLGLRQLALYQNYYFIFQALNSFFGVIFSALIPSVGNSLITSSKDKIYRNFKKFNFMYAGIATWCAACLICLYQPFMEVWVGKENMLDMGMVVLFTLYFFIFKWCDMLQIYQDASGLWWDARFIPLLGALLNLVVNIILVQIISLAGIVISTIISIFLVFDIGYSVVIFKRYFSDIPHSLAKFWLGQFYYFFCMFIASLAMYFITNHFVTFDSAILRLIIDALLCVIVPTGILLFMWHKLPEYIDAKEFVLNIINNFLNKNKNKEVVE